VLSTQLRRARDRAVPNIVHVRPDERAQRGGPMPRLRSSTST
jgi:hypothetical protein